MIKQYQLWLSPSCRWNSDAQTRYLLDVSRFSLRILL